MVLTVSFVVIVILFFRQKYRMKIHRLQMLSDFYLLTGIIDTNSRPADPMFLHGNLQGVEPRCQTSFTTYESIAVLPRHSLYRQSVCNDI